MIANLLFPLLWPNSLYRAACFANFEGILGFSVPSIILADLLGNKCLLVIGAFRSTLFVSAFQGSLLVIALFRAIVDQFSSNIFLIFLILVSWKNKAMSASCHIAILEQSTVILSFVFAGQAGRVRCIVINMNSAPTQMFDGTEKPIRSLQMCSAIQRMWL